jgi:predicted transglutaminase-like cysteine proteinase
MIRALHSLSGHLRVLVVAALTCLAIFSGLSSAQANVITAAHLVQGEQMLPDGGWTSACDTRIEHCTVSDATADHDALYGLHHHHHADYQFGATAATLSTASEFNRDERSSLPAYVAVIKDVTPSSVDQPPKI